MLTLGTLIVYTHKICCGLWSASMWSILQVNKTWNVELGNCVSSEQPNFSIISVYFVVHLPSFFILTPSNLAKSDCCSSVLSVPPCSRLMSVLNQHFYPNTDLCPKLPVCNAMHCPARLNKVNPGVRMISWYFVLYFCQRLFALYCMPLNDNKMNTFDIKMFFFSLPSRKHLCTSNQIKLKTLKWKILTNPDILNLISNLPKKCDYKDNQNTLSMGNC